ncbi:MAG: hypothetical protein PHC53_05565 [Patescibacteria group bacterium]|nr:hypothetical protein [Patescibacteria group bacterium]
MSPRNIRLVQIIAKEILDREGFRLLHNTNPELPDKDLTYMFFDKKGLVGDRYDGKFSSNDRVCGAVSKKTKHLKPEVLGRIISTKVDPSEGRVSWDDVWGDPVVFHLSENGIDMLRELAERTIAAAIYDELLKNMEERLLTTEEVNAFGRSHR